jgi:hypothetical protein
MMNVNSKLIYPALVLIVAALAGCGHGVSDGPYGAKGVDWYAAHTTERTAQLQWCSQQSDAVQTGNKGCAQAGAGAQKAWLNSNKNYVPGG